MPLIAEYAALRGLCAPGGREMPPPRPAPSPSTPASSPEVCPDPGEVLADRRSVRQFASRPIPVALLAAACRNAMQVEQAWWPSEAHGDAGLRIAVSAAQVDGLARGVHTFSMATAEFEYLAGPALVDELQREYASAPAIVLVCAERGRDTAQRSSYQSMLIRAGTLGHAALLSAMGNGLRGCPFGRAMSKVPATLSERYAAPVRHLFTMAIGWPAEAQL